MASKPKEGKIPENGPHVKVGLTSQVTTQNTRIIFTRSYLYHFISINLHDGHDLLNLPAKLGFGAFGVID